LGFYCPSWASFHDPAVGDASTQQTDLITDASDTTTGAASGEAAFIAAGGGTTGITNAVSAFEGDCPTGYYGYSTCCTTASTAYEEALTTPSATATDNTLICEEAAVLA